MLFCLASSHPFPPRCFLGASSRDSSAPTAAVKDTHAAPMTDCGRCNAQTIMDLLYAGQWEEETSPSPNLQPNVRFWCNKKYLCQCHSAHSIRPGHHFAVVFTPQQIQNTGFTSCFCCESVPVKLFPFKKY